MALVCLFAWLRSIQIYTKVYNQYRQQRGNYMVGYGAMGSVCRDFPTLASIILMLGNTLNARLGEIFVWRKFFSCMYGTWKPSISYMCHSHACTSPQEGFASEARFDWLARLYFLSFNIITRIIFEVAIAFLVEAFVYKVLARQRDRLCRKHKQAFKYCQCPEGELLSWRQKIPYFF